MAHVFDEFVKERVARAEEFISGLNREERIAKWLHELGNLYNDMRRYLKSYTDSGQIRIESRKTEITEEHLGTYDTESLTLIIGADKVEAIPIGTLLIGSRGRVDLCGERGTRRIVLLDVDTKSENDTMPKPRRRSESSSISLVSGQVDQSGWYIATQPPNVVVKRLDEDSFQEAIMDVSGA